MYALAKIGLRRPEKYIAWILPDTFQVWLRCILRKRQPEEMVCWVTDGTNWCCLQLERTRRT
jgi:hypothetical protein